MELVLTPELILSAYRQGLFPMAHSASSKYVQWVCPEMRGILPIEGFHVSKSLKKAIKRGLRYGSYNITINTDFGGVIGGCAAPASSRPETWINAPIKSVFIDLHRQGHAHSVEYWEDGKLCGGVYGLAIGAAFFGESMFSRVPNASKIALTHLVARLSMGGFQLLDTQFLNDHLKQFGCREIPHRDYVQKLNYASVQPANFYLDGIEEEEIIRRFLGTS